MFALTFSEYGTPDGLTVGDATEPHAGPGQVRIVVRGASVNPIDWKKLSGMLAGGAALEQPGRLGYDAAGVVDEVGEDVTDVAVGDDVFGLGADTQAEFAVLNSWVPKPSSVDWSVAAAAGVAAETSERALRLLGVSSGDTLFVAGGSGGVGAVVIQLAVARGLKVVASASESNQDYLREIGATPVVYGDGIVDRVREAAPDGVDAVFDVAGKTPIEDLLSLAPEPKKVLSIANFTIGDTGAQVTGGGADAMPVPALTEAADLLQHSKLVIKVQTFPFDRAGEAYRLSQAGHVRGKLVLVPDSLGHSG